MGRPRAATLTPNVDELINLLQRDLPRLRGKYAIRSLGLFGSYVRGEQRRRSDLDVLIDFENVPGLLKFMELEAELTSLLGVPVDLVQKEALKPALGKRILQEVRLV